MNNVKERIEDKVTELEGILSDIVDYKEDCIGDQKVFLEDALDQVEAGISLLVNLPVPLLVSHQKSNETPIHWPYARFSAMFGGVNEETEVWTNRMMNKFPIGEHDGFVETEWNEGPIYIIVSKDKNDLFDKVVLVERIKRVKDD